MKYAASSRNPGTWVGGLMIALLTLVPVAYAEPAPPGAPELPTDPVLAGLIDQSLAARPELAQARANATAARARISQVGTLPDPMLQLGVQNDGFKSWEVGKMETSYYSIMLSQTFPWAGKLGLRSRSAGLGVTQAEENVARIALSTEAEVRRAYLALVVAQDRLALLDRLEAISRQAAGTAQARYESGSAPQADLLRAQLEVMRIRQRRWSLQVESEQAVQTLNRLRGRPLDEPIRPQVHIADLAVPTVPPDSVAIADAFQRSPELAAAKAGVAQGALQLALARKSYAPDLTVNLGVMPRGAMFPPMWLASIAGPLPIFGGSRQSRAVAESRALWSAGQSNAQAVEQVVRLRVEQRRTALAATLETMRLYREGLLTLSESTAKSMLSQYEVGQGSFLSVLEANTGLIADQETYLQILAEAQSLQIAAAEVSLDPVGAPNAGMGSSSVPSTAGMGSSASPAAAGMGAGASSPPAAGTQTGAGSSSGSGM